MGIMLGNLSVSQIETRLGITFSDEDRETLIKTHQEAVNNTPLADGCWHCFDLPFMVFADTKATAEKLVKLFTKYDPSTFKEAIKLSWERI